MKKIVFMGTPDFSVPVLEELLATDYEVVLVVTQPDRVTGRRRKMTRPPVKKAAEKHGIPVFQPEKIAKDYETITNLQPDLIITAAYGQLLPNELLDNPKFGCINVHASLLPELRGGAPIHHAILQGKDKTGITIMYMVEKLDAGDILTQEKVVIEQTDDVGILHDKLSKVGASLLIETLPKLFANELTAIKQKEAEATFAANITRNDEKIDWANDHVKVYNQIRGLRPWPVAYTTLENVQIKIWDAELTEQTYEGKPGEVVDIAEDSFTVICGNQRAVRITELQPAGRTRMTVADFLRGSSDRITKETILGA